MTRLAVLRRTTAGAAALLSLALATQLGVVATSASWNDTEWVVGPQTGIGTLDCSQATGSFATRGEGRMLGGALLRQDLDTLVQASGMRVTNDGDGPSYSPSGATPAPQPEAFANPLDVSALRALSVDLGGGLLQLPLNNSTGVIGQYAQARSTGLAVGAAGLVDDNGAIATRPGNDYPDLGSLGLSSLLAAINPGVASALGTNVSDVSLKIGAVAGRAAIDGCDGTWRGDPAGAVQRDFLAASLRTEVTSKLVRDLHGIAFGSVNGLDAAARGLPANTTMLNGIVGSVTGVVQPVLDLPILNSLVRLTPGGLSVVLDPTVPSLGALQTLLAQPVRDANGVVSVDLAAGVVTVDTAALLAQAYPAVYGAGLNALPPNTELLVDEHVLSTLSSALNGALVQWVDDVNAALLAAVNGLQLRATVRIGLDLCTATLLLACLKWTNVGTVTAVVSGSLAQLQAGTGAVSVDTSLLNGSLLGGLLNPLVNGLTGALQDNLQGILGSAVNGVIGVYRSLPATALPAAQAIAPVISAAFRVLYLNGIVTILVNAQNDPTAPGSGPEPADWGGVPGGRYDVAALRIGVLAALGADEVRLYLGRGSVGRVCALPADAAACPGY